MWGKEVNEGARLKRMWQNVKLLDPSKGPRKSTRNYVREPFLLPWFPNRFLKELFLELPWGLYIKAQKCSQWRRITLCTTETSSTDAEGFVSSLPKAPQRSCTGVPSHPRPSPGGAWPRVGPELSPPQGRDPRAHSGFWDAPRPSPAQVAWRPSAPWRSQAAVVSPGTAFKPGGREARAELTGGSAHDAAGPAPRGPRGPGDTDCPRTRPKEHFFCLFFANHAFQE